VPGPRYRDRVRRVGVIVAAFACALAAAPLANASFIVARNASQVSLHIRGTHAIVGYRTRGVWRHAELWGAIGARTPNSRVAQVAFHRTYGVGRKSSGSCRRYDGPPLPLLVAACTAPDGSFWALQSWQRLLPNYGGTRAPFELHLSHWRGPLAKLEVWTDWSYGGRFQHLFGRLTYKDAGVHGFHSTSRGNPLDSYGRNLYLDTLDSRYGPGWHRDNGFLAHGPGGTFCYGLYRHGSHPSGRGRAYRLTVTGPGVTPIVRWHAAAPGPYDAALDRRLNGLERSLGDPKCRQQ
jgi:hypothetical protein